MTNLSLTPKREFCPTDWLTFTVASLSAGSTSLESGSAFDGGIAARAPLRKVDSY